MQEFCGERLVVFKSRTPRAVGGDGHTVARGLCKLDAVPDDGIEVAAGEMPANLIDDRLHEGGAACIQRHEHASRDMVIGLFGQHLKRLEQFSDAVQRKETGIHRDDRFRAGLQRIERQKADVGWAIDDDVVVGAPHAGDRVRQDVLPADEAGERVRDRTQQNIGGRHIEVLADGADDVTKSSGLSGCSLQEQIVHGPRRRTGLGEKAQSRMALRVHVHEQHSSLLAREKGRKIDGCDGLSTPALLVHDRYRAHTRSFWFLCVLPPLPGSTLANASAK